MIAVKLAQGEPWVLPKFERVSTKSGRKKAVLF
jgi:hypothetical protein